jgi:hypothetical protein
MRDVTEAQKEVIAYGLKDLGPYEVALLCARGKTEAYQFADQLASAIKEAGWHVRQPLPQDWTIPPVGVAVGVVDYVSPGPAALALLHVLNAANISDRSDVERVTATEPGNLFLIVGDE